MSIRHPRRPILRRPPRLLSLEDRIAPAVMMLPDFQVLSSYLNGWTINNLGGDNREIRFSTGLANGGKGAFELNGTSTTKTNPDGTQSQQVVQKIYWDDKTTTTRVAGWFTYHPTHGHVHFDDMAWGQLRTRPTSKWEDGAVVAVGPKTSFCLIDINRFNGGLPGSPPSSVYNSCSTQTQGISVGWNDVYSSGLDGQSINITGLPAGDYWLEVVSDPLNSIMETDDTNNTTRVAITISKTQVPTVGFRVQDADPTGSQQNAISSIEIGFNQNVNAASVEPSDFVVTGPDGPITVTSVTQLDAVRFRANFATQSKVGTYTYTIGPNISNTAVPPGLMDQNNNGTGGEATDVFINVFTISAPRIIGTTPSGGLTTPVSAVQVTYNRPMDSSTFTTADIVSFTGPGGVNLLPQLTGVVPVTSGGASAIFNINFTTQSAIGNYSMVIGPNILDENGRPVDQNGDGMTDALDNFTASFTINPVGVSGPDPFGYVAVATSVPSASIVGRTGVFTIHTNSDDETAAVNLGSNTFRYYNTQYTGNNNVWVNTNGMINFGSTGSKAYENDDLTTSTIPTLAILWDDWISGSGSPQVIGLLEDTTGDSVPDRLIVEWNQVYHYSPGGSPSGMTFQGILELNTGVKPGNIFYNYIDLNANNSAYNNGASATVGWRGDPASNSRIVISQNASNNALVQTGKAVRISVPQVQSILRVDSNPNSDQEVEFLVTFSNPVTGVDSSDFGVVPGGGVTGAVVDHIHTTADPAVYSIHVQGYVGNGTLRLDLIDNDSITSNLGAKLGGLGNGNGTYTKGEVYNIVQAPPQIQGFNIGDGTLQRSTLRLAQVIFDRGVVFAGPPSDAFVLTGPNGPVTMDVDTSLSTPGQTIARLTFTGAGAEFGSLRDGDYTLTVLSSKISTGGVALDGDGDGNAGGNGVTTFHRLFGDINGDRTVNNEDFTAFRGAFGTTENALDFDNDGSVGTSDFLAFRVRFGSFLP